MKGVKKTNAEPSSAPPINGALMFQKMEQQCELARAMKKRALEMYEDALAMAAQCRSRVQLT